MRQFLCDEFYLLVYMRSFARILCGKYICRKTSVPIFMWQTQIVNYEYLFVYMTRHIFVACTSICTIAKLCAIIISLLKLIFCIVKIFVVSSTQAIIFIMENCQTKISHVNGALL